MQIQNRITRQRAKTAGQPTLEEFVATITSRFSQNPDEVADVHQPFLTYWLTEGNKFIFIWSTRALQQVAASRKMVQLDATYKILYAGFPVFVSS